LVSHGEPTNLITVRAPGTDFDGYIGEVDPAGNPPGTPRCVAARGAPVTLGA